MSHQLIKQRNTLQTLLLLCCMCLLLIMVGVSIFGSSSIPMILFVAVVATLLSPKASAWLTLRLYRARQLAPHNAPELYQIVEELTQRAGISTVPLLFYIPSSSKNGFAMLAGEQPIIAVTDGLLRILDLREIRAVLAHEVSHIKNGDLKLMMLADLLSRLTALLASSGWLLLLLFLPIYLFSQIQLPWLSIVLLLAAPTLANLLQLALSRTREFDADADAAMLTGDPAGLAAALTKIETHNQPWWIKITLPGRNSDPSLLRSHPPTEERIERLQQLAASSPITPRHELTNIHLTPEYQHIHTPRRWRGFGIWY